jgi:hypothetical protein
MRSPDEEKLGDWLEFPRFSGNSCLSPSFSGRCGALNRSFQESRTDSHFRAFGGSPAVGVAALRAFGGGLIPAPEFFITATGANLFRQGGGLRSV